MHQPFSRRAALKASGVAIALPLLESMSSAIGGTEIPTAKRMVLICNTLGLYSPALYPEKNWTQLQVDRVSEFAEGSPRKVHIDFWLVTPRSKWKTAA